MTFTPTQEATLLEMFRFTREKLPQLTLDLITAATNADQKTILQAVLQEFSNSIISIKTNVDATKTNVDTTVATKLAAITDVTGAL